MARWLVKEEPTHYSYADLERDGSTEWTGVHNPLALRHLRTMKRGDEVFFYQSGTERAVVGVMRVSAGPRPDPSDARGSSFVTLRPVRRLRRPVPLATLKHDAVLRAFPLVRFGRLTVMPVTEREWKQVLSHERD